MIPRTEISQKALLWGVPPDTVDKDWVLGHFLSAFYQIGDHKDKLVFKGGTCLRKCRFPEYRFSEDLDFTSLDSEYKLTRKVIRDIINMAGSVSGIQFHIGPLNDLIHRDNLAGYQAKIRYWGADHSKNQLPPDPQRWMTRIKIEVTLYELLIFDPQDCLINHSYSDAGSISPQKIPCYDLKEIMSEKIRSLVQRSYTAPRDVYDIWKLRDKFDEKDWTSIQQAFLEKMKFKGHEYTGADQLLSETSVQKLRNAWNRSLVPQLKPSDLPEFELVIDELKVLFKTYLD